MLCQSMRHARAHISVSARLAGSHARRSQLGLPEKRPDPCAWRPRPGVSAWRAPDPLRRLFRAQLRTLECRRDRSFGDSLLVGFQCRTAFASEQRRVLADEPALVSDERLRYQFVFGTDIGTSDAGRARPRQEA